MIPEQGRAPGRKASGRVLRLFPELAPLSLLVLAFVVVQTVLLDPPILYDPIEYFLQASRLPDVQPHHRSLRIGLLLPVRAAQSVFGYSEFAYYAVPYLAGLTLSISTYVLSRAYWRRSISFASGLVVVLNPYVLSEVDQIYPDLLGVAVFTAACAVLVWAARLQVERAQHPVAVRTLLILGGALLGWSYLVREAIVVLFPVVLLILWWEHVPLRLFAYVAVPACAMFVGESFYNGIIHGDPMARPRAVLERGRLTPAYAQDLVASRRAARGSRLDRLVTFPGLLLDARAGPVFFLSVPAALIGAASERSRRMLIPVAWSLWYWALVTALGVFEEEIGQNILRSETMRYWYVVFPPLVIAGLGGSTIILRRAIGGSARLREALGGAIVVGGVIVYSAAVLHRPVSEAINPATGPNAFRQLRSWISTQHAPEVTTIWTTQRTAWIMGMYVHTPVGTPVWDGEVRSINTVRSFLDRRDLTEGMFLLNDDFFRPRHSNWREATPPYLVDPPRDWAIRFASDDSELILYAIGAGRGNTEEIVIGNSTKRWLFRPRTPGAGERHRFSADPSVDLRVEPGDRATIESGELSMLTLHRDDVLRMHLDIGAEGAGNVVPYCFFKGADGTRVRALAATAWGLPADPGTVELVCAVPDGLAGPVSLIVGTSLIGPVDVQLGTLRIDVSP